MNRVLGGRGKTTLQMGYASKNEMVFHIACTDEHLKIYSFTVKAPHVGQPLPRLAWAAPMREKHRSLCSPPGLELESVLRDLLLSNLTVLSIVRCTVGGSPPCLHLPLCKVIITVASRVKKPSLSSH